jgi:ketol-acid reductoisomerase
MNEKGIAGMRFSISETAKWGDVTVGPKIIDASVKKRMKAALKDIQSGKFAKEWVKEYEGRLQEDTTRCSRQGRKHGIEKDRARSCARSCRGCRSARSRACRRRTRRGRLASKAEM